MTALVIPPSPADLTAYAQRRITIDSDGCWIWTGARRAAYGLFNARGAHRVIYEKLVGPVPSDLELDHLCKVTLCCNPQHLEPVTHTENKRSPGGRQSNRGL